MLNFVNLLASGSAIDSNLDTLRITLSVIMIVLMGIAALAAIVLVLMQPSNSTGVSALGGSSETFFGKNKGRTMEAKLSFLTKIFGVIFFILALVSALLFLFGV